jgi:hypothetical protein
MKASAHLTLRSTIQESEKEMRRLLDLQHEATKQNRLSKDVNNEISTEFIHKSTLSPQLPSGDIKQQRSPQRITTRSSILSYAVESYYLNLQ